MGQLKRNFSLCTTNTKRSIALIIKSKPLEACKAEPLKPKKRNNERKLILETSQTVWFNSGEAFKPRSQDLQDKPQDIIAIVPKHSALRLGNFIAFEMAFLQKQ